MEIKRIADESIKPLTTFDNSLNPKINYFDNARIRVKCDGNCLKQEKLAFAHKKVNISIVYEINLWPFTGGQDFTLGNSLFGAVKSLT